MHYSTYKDPQEVLQLNEYLKKGCPLEGHGNMPLLSIFTRVEDSNKTKSVFGCAECVSVRSGDRTISLVKVANI